MHTKHAALPAALLAATLSAMAVPAAAGAELTTDRGAAVSRTAGALIAFPNPYGDGTPNPVQGGTARVQVVATPSGRSIVTLGVQGLLPMRTFGAHVHVTPCEVAKGSGHYQNVPGLVSEENEIWLDFTTDAQGNGSSTAVRDWLIRPGGASSVIIHDHGTDHMAGTAGPKLGCLDVDF